MTKASSILGVPQIDLETKFYMVDIPSLIEDKRVQQNQEKLSLVNMMIAANNRTMANTEFNKFIKPLLPEGALPDMNKFNRAKVEQLRSMQG